jgi:hypothetical protein
LAGHASEASSSGIAAAIIAHPIRLRAQTSQTSRRRAPSVDIVRRQARTRATREGELSAYGE